MARKKKSKNKKRNNKRNFVAIAMIKRNTNNAGPMRDKRLKRKSRNTWKKNEDLES